MRVGVKKIYALQFPTSTALTSPEAQAQVQKREQSQMGTSHQPKCSTKVRYKYTNARMVCVVFVKNNPPTCCR